MLAVILAVGLIIAIFLGIYLPTNRSGSFAAFVKVVGVCCVVLAVVNPRLGLNILVVQGAYFDLLKRLAVYFGSASFLTVVEILVIPMLTLAACATGGVVRTFLQKGHLERREFLLLVLVAIVGGVFFLRQAGMYGVMKGAQLTYGGVGFMLVLPLFFILMRDVEDVMNFLRFTFWALLPVALYGLRQAFFGFTDFEVYYAKTGFTVTAGEVFAVVPRPFSTLSSTSAMSVMGGCVLFGYWHVLNHRRRRLLYFLASFIFFIAMLSSLARSTIVMFPVMILAYHFFKTPFRTFCLYSAVVGVFVVLVFSSKTLLRNIDAINEWMPSSSVYSQRAFNVSTFSDRLIGLSQLTNPKRWTLFGVSSAERRKSVEHERYGSKYYAHDGINGILLGYGVLGMVVVFGGGAGMLFAAHRRYFRYRGSLPEYESLVRLGLAYCVPFIALNMGSGQIMHVSPVNIFFWSMAAAAGHVLASAADHARARMRATLESDAGGRLPEAPGMAPAHLRFGNR